MKKYIHSVVVALMCVSLHATTVFATDTDCGLISYFVSGKYSGCLVRGKLRDISQDQCDSLCQSVLCVEGGESYVVEIDGKHYRFHCDDETVELTDDPVTQAPVLDSSWIFLGLL